VDNEHEGIIETLRDLRAAQRERDDLRNRLRAARADHAAAEEYLAGIVRVWQRVDEDNRRAADVCVPGLAGEIEGARDGREGAWWEVTR
jgi:hypothetical protein